MDKLTYEIERKKREELYKEVAKKFFFQGTKAFSEALRKQKLPDWNEFFEQLWTSFFTIKLVCLKCNNRKILKLEVYPDCSTLDIKEYYNDFTGLICETCGTLVPSHMWREVREITIYNPSMT